MITEMELVRITRLRLEWAPRSVAEAPDLNFHEDVVTKEVKTPRVGGSVQYQRCGGGVRVIRKRLGAS